MKTTRNSWKLAAVLLLLVLSSQVFAQDDGPDRRPVNNVFASTLLIDQQTTVGPSKGTLELLIHHRFGTMQNGLKDLIGIYAPSNIRMGFNYGITDKLSVGIGTEKNNKLQDVYAKYQILQQKRTGMPISLAYILQIGLDARSEEVFGKNYAFTNRFSYFNQVIVSKKFGTKLSLQVAPSFSHFNAVDSTMRHDYAGISAGARYRIINDFSLIGTYDQAFSLLGERDYMVAPKPSFGLGIEIATPTHCFHVFASNYDKILPQKNMAFNTNTIGGGEILLGFNLTVRF